MGKLLHQAGYSLPASVKVHEGPPHADSDAQFRYLNEQARAFRDASLPVVSVDANKKEPIGEFKNVGKEWHPKGRRGRGAWLPPEHRERRCRSWEAERLPL